MTTPPDVEFPTYPFRSSTDTTRALRSTRDRITDEISVLEFGAVSSGTICQATLQKAFDSGENLYFPQGDYVIDNPILIPDDDAHRVIRGAGTYTAKGGSDNGTRIKASNVAFSGFRDYLWKTPQVYSPKASITSISGMTFDNGYKIGTGFDTTLITQVDPPSASAFAGNGMGCLYLQLGWLRITNIVLGNVCGVGLHFPGINNYLSTFQANGGFSGGFVADGGPASQTFSCGVWGSECTITSGKVQGYRYGICTMQGPTFLSEFDTERCQVGFMTSNPLPFWDRNENLVFGVRSQGGGIVSMHAINLESFGSDSEGGCAAELIGGPIDISGLAMTASGQIGIPDCLLLLNGAGGVIKGVNGGGSVLTAGILQKDGATPYGFRFTHCSPKVQAGKPLWDVLNHSNVQKDTAGRNGYHFTGCNTNGAILYNQLPLSNPLVFNDQLISDCPLPEVDYSAATPVSNHGKTVLAGSSTNLTRVVCRPIVKLAATANWNTSSTTITMTTNPSDGSGGFVVKPGMIIFNDIDDFDPGSGQIQARGVYIGVVLTFISTVLTLAVNPNITSGVSTAAAAGTAGDVLIFGCWTVA